MFKLISVEEEAMERFVELINIETNESEKCFDDSALKSISNFGFMKLGGIYDCKILLFGKTVNKKEERTVECTVVRTNLQIGNTDVLEVKVGDNVYYVESIKVNVDFGQNKFLFKVGRKDLIQVNHIIHGDLV